MLTEERCNTPLLAAGLFIHKKVEDAFKRLATTKANALTLKIAGILADSTEEAFASETDPTTGIKWIPLSEAHVAWKSKHGYSSLMLEQSGRMVIYTSIKSKHLNGMPTFFRTSCNANNRATFNLSGLNSPPLGA